MLSLEKLCLELIVYKFERFHFAFTISQNDDLQRNFECLQRKYSVQLATELSEKGQLKEEYFEFVINEHLNFFDCKWYNNKRYLKEELDFLESKWLDNSDQEEEQHNFFWSRWFNNSDEEEEQHNFFWSRWFNNSDEEEEQHDFFWSKWFNNSHQEEEHFDFLDSKWFKNRRPVEDIFCRLPNLKRICFTSDDGDEYLENVAKFCPNIIEIDARSSRVTDNGIKYLCERENGQVPCPQLKNLFLNFRVTDNGVECLLRNLPSLERIDYINVPNLLYFIHKESLLKSEKLHCYNLIELNFLHCYNLPNFADILKTCFTICPKLESVHCHIYNIEEFISFTNNHLKKLNLNFFEELPKYKIDNFLRIKGSNLSSLHISNFILSVSLLAVHCPVLKEFSAEDVSFTHDVEMKPKFPFLKKCILSRVDPSTRTSMCLLFSCSPNLETISLTSCVLSREMKNQILGWCKNPSAKQVDFCFLTLEMEFLRDILMSCCSLKEMSLTDCSVDFLDPETILESIAETLPNKPEISFSTMTFNLV